jgi:hypothetical protein
MSAAIMIAVRMVAPTFPAMLRLTRDDQPKYKVNDPYERENSIIIFERGETLLLAHGE